MNNLLVASLLFLLIGCLPQQAAALPGGYEAEVLEIIDGDTFRVRVSIWPGHDLTTLVRLRGIDAPEKNGHCPAEKEMAQKARTRLTGLVKDQMVILHDIENGKYAGRVLANVRLSDGTDISHLLLKENMVRSYNGQKRKTWCS